MCMEVSRYTDESGQFISNFDTISSALPPPDHEWVGDWKLWVDTATKQTDKDGWSYALKFEGLTKGRKLKIQQFFILLFIIYYFFSLIYLFIHLIIYLLLN